MIDKDTAVKTFLKFLSDLKLNGEEESFNVPLKDGRTLNMVVKVEEPVVKLFLVKDEN